GDIFVVGQHWGRVRALLNERNQRVESAGPSTPVQVLGIDGVPEAGDRFIVLNDEKKAREIAQRRQQIHREQMYHQKKGLTLDEFSRRMKEGEAKELKILVKADVDGSAQALADALTQLSVDEVKVDVIRRAVGPITETDVLFASASESIIIGFHVRPTAKAKELAEREHVDIRLYRVIYEAIDDVKKALEGMLEPVEREVVLGTAEVRQVFKISRVGTVAGCYVLNGKIVRNARVRLIRNDVEIYEGRLSSLKRFKEDVREVAAGYECGLTIENYNDIKVGDIIEAFEIVQESKTLEQAKSQQQNK
ncbi:MAG TPA: translation initiation factor IF-2, partial [Calditrichae bacterium]|nr:translation initiation factor IF-2 [Calditrichia bacterium]